MAAGQANLLLGFAQGRRGGVAIAGIDAAAGKCNLPGMVVQMVSTPRQK